MIPEELKYTEEHEWVQRTGETTVRLGITDFAQAQLGDVVFVQLPELGEKVSAGQTLGEVESTKSVSDIYAPLAGEVTARNDSLDQQPDLINEDPYGEGWMVELRLDDTDAFEGLLDAAAYQELVQE
ncbi:glycine cleavage system protein GcvH [Actinosynnema pretiosum subsp. pretiosum]|uniref:Glycine cleavage system H protein n=3 Tax=Actinosynnema TaxID=40566 RepID=C6W9Y7_ACTMD|nr:MULTISPECIES: glycine cleavage system protein GcvH [Actinosynnema]ACU39176.1 glycine cleavage system H protein [Actinosynnema mirum DSM 43827]ATE58409.1 glycine cleavage system protein H [Actinosynnema pretiosum]AXX32775.1 Glycine cleavage system H protein [Actinosynnema pretiosum subsp. pretiosum]QUF03349.1 glycine cleavage system protein GcvH [Actinosynnema pretiosum subsp. pretiosum]